MDTDPALDAAVRSIPDGAELAWYSDCVPEGGDNAGSSWVDIGCDTLETVLGWAWVWTLVPPGDEDAECLEMIVWPYDAIVDGRPAWTIRAVSAAIADWCLRHAGRLVRPVYDVAHGPSAGMVEAIRRMEAVKAGEMESYTIGVTDDGMPIKAVGPALDELARFFMDGGEPRDLARLLGDPDDPHLT